MQILYVPKDATKSVIYVGGVGGGWDSKARELYSKLASKLASNGINSLRITPSPFNRA